MLEDVFGPNPLRRTRTFKYDSRPSGIRVPADAAAVNANFWLTSNDADHGSEGGSLSAWSKAMPVDRCISVTVPLGEHGAPRTRATRP